MCPICISGFDSQTFPFYGYDSHSLMFPFYRYGPHSLTYPFYGYGSRSLMFRLSSYSSRSLMFRLSSYSSRSLMFRLSSYSSRNLMFPFFLQFNNLSLRTNMSVCMSVESDGKDNVILKFCCCLDKIFSTKIETTMARSKFPKSLYLFMELSDSSSL
jgi:hypothetical protein